MKKVKAIIERDGNDTYGVCAPELENVIIGSGDTLAEAKDDSENSFREMVEAYTDSGKVVPDEMTDVVFEYRCDNSIKSQTTIPMEKITDMKMRLQDILLSISWRELSTHYFGKSCSWLYHKLDGIDGNGKQGGFTPEEAEQLKSALNDLADRIRRAADSI